MKPGIRTSEFWLIALVVLAALAGMVTRRLPAEYGTVLSLLLPAFWAWLRAQAKMTPGTFDDEVIERLAPDDERPAIDSAPESPKLAVVPREPKKEETH